MNKRQIIEYMVEVLGYSNEDLLDYDQIELLGVLSDIQIQEAIKYIGVTK
jgi:hypothetical protein